MTKKDIALEKIESHEKLCRIMQKQTHDKIHKIENQIDRIEKIFLIRVFFLKFVIRYISYRYLFIYLNVFNLETISNSSPIYRGQNRPRILSIWIKQGF